MEQVKNSAQPQVKTSKVDQTFNLVKINNEIKIAIGNYQISRRTFKSFQAAEDYLRQRPYEILINTTCLFTNLQLKQNETNKEIKQVPNEEK